MKKLLALVLALVMSMSLVTISNAAFDDADDIDYTEAVEVMNAIGVLEGSDGKFSPKAELTRAQAAKIICVMLLGKTAADGLNLDSSFADVSGWAESYIAYCASQGIVAGVGDGKFDPDGKLTGYQFAKMLLVALGYKADLEGMTGADWQVAVAKLALNNDLNDGLEISLSKTLTRDEAAQMAFNTLTATLVAYTNGVNVSTSDGTTVTVDANNYKVGDAGEVAGDGYSYTATPYTQFCEQYFPKLAKAYVAGDDFGRPASKWTYKGIAIGTYGDTADKTYTAAASGSTSAAKIDNLGIKGFTFPVGGATLTVNGKAGANVTSLNDVVSLTGNGVVVELFLSANNAEQIKSIVVTNTVLAQVASKTSARVNLTAKNSVAGVGALYVNDDEDLFDTAKGFDVDEYVLVVPVWSASDNRYVVDSIVAAQSVTGKITSVAKKSDGTTNSKVTVADATYSVSKNADTSVTGAAIDLTKESTVWVDAYGYAIYAKASTEAADSLAYVLKGYSALKGGEIVPMARLVKTNGDVVDVQVNSAITAATLNKVVKITAISDADVYTLAANTAVTPGDSLVDVADTNIFTDTKVTPNVKAGHIALADSKTIEASDKKLDGTDFTVTNYFASDVKFVYVNKTSNTAIVKEGVQKVTTPSSPNASYAIFEQVSSTDATMVVTMVILENTTATSAAADDVLYINDATVTDVVTLHNTDTDKDVSVSGYTAYKNGEKITIYASAAPTAKKFYTYAESDAVKGSYVLTEYAASTGDNASVVDEASTAVFDGRFMTTSTDSIDLTTAKAIVDLRSAQDQADMPIVLTAKGLCDAHKTYNGIKVSYLYDDDKGEATIVYVIDEGTGYTVTEQAAATIGGSTKYATTTTGTKFGGDTMTVTVTTSEAAVAAGGEVIDVKVNGTVVGTVSFEAGAATGSTKTCTFTMPEANATITLAAHV